MKNGLLCLTGIAFILTGIYNTKFSIHYANGIYTKTNNFDEGYWLLIIIGTCLLLGTTIYHFVIGKNNSSIHKTTKPKIAWISLIRNLLQVGFIITILSMFIISFMFIGNHFFDIPQKPLQIEVPYVLNGDQLNQLNNIDILPEGSTIKDKEIKLNVAMKKAGGFSWLILLMVMLLLGLIAYGIKVLVNILKSSEQGAFFTYPNAKRIEMIGHLCIIYAFLSSFTQILAANVPNLMEGLTAFSMHHKLKLEIIIVGCLLYVLAFIWKEGIRMQEEIKLTI